MSRRDWCVATLCESKVTKKRRQARERAEERARDEAGASLRARSEVATMQLDPAEAAFIASRQEALRRAIIPPGFRRVYTALGDYLEPIPGWTP